MSWQAAAAMLISISAFIAYYWVGNGRPDAAPKRDAGDTEPHLDATHYPPTTHPVDPAVLARFQHALDDLRQTDDHPPATL